MNSTAGLVDKMRDSDVVTGYLGKSDRKQEQEDKEKLQYAYNHLVECQENMKSCKGLSGQEARRLYDKYSGHSNPELRRWAESMRALIPVTLSYDTSAANREPSSSGSGSYDSDYCKSIRAGRTVVSTESMRAANCFER